MDDIPSKVSLHKFDLFSTLLKCELIESNSAVYNTYRFNHKIDR